MESATIIPSEGKHPIGQLVGQNYRNGSEAIPRKIRPVLTVWAYGIFAALIALIALGLFLFFAYVAFGVTALCVAMGLIVLGGYLFVKFVMLYAG